MKSGFKIMTNKAPSVAIVLVAVFSMAGLTPCFAGTKADSTPTFCQKDPEAAFDNEGSNFCAPTSLSDGLIYLAQSRGLNGLVVGTGHNDQIAMIKELAEDMNTDADIGTDPSQILSGLRKYVASKGYSFARLELSTWRPVNKANKQYKISSVPDLAWMRKAAADPDCVVIFNAGWYREEAEGFSRHSGHWVSVVGVGPGPGQFLLHNPLLPAIAQATRSLVSLQLLTDDFDVVHSGTQNGSRKGYYSMKGPGLPFGGKTKAAILDSVIVFSLKKKG